MMDNSGSIFNTLFQTTLYNLVFKMIERMEVKATSPAANQLDQSAIPSVTPGPQTGNSFDSLIRQAAERYGVPTGLVQAVVKAESNYRPDAVSSAGALGLMQLMPATARGLGVTDPMDPQQNIDGGVRLLSQLLTRYDGDVRLALAAYNAGPGAVNRYGGIPPYRETQIYVQRVMGYYQSNLTWSG